VLGLVTFVSETPDRPDNEQTVDVTESVVKAGAYDTSIRPTFGGSVLLDDGKTRQERLLTALASQQPKGPIEEH
jgi:hypothetical protein